MQILLETAQGHLRWEYPMVVNEKDESVLVYIPEGEFEMGDGKDWDCPKHKVYLDAYYIGIYCVTNAQYARFVEETGHRPPDKADYYSTSVWSGKNYPADKADHPVVCVSWEDAQAYAKWSGLSLPTEAQWEKAARGPKGWIYPWGNDWDEIKCKNWNNKGNKTTATVYSYSKGVSGYGTYNQAGNIYEWCEDWYDDGYYKNSPARNPRGAGNGSSRVYRGGCWRYDGASNFRGARRFWDSPGYRFDYLGFRLVRAVS